MNHIHNHQGVLPDQEAAHKDEAARSQEQQVLQILRGHPDRYWAYFEIIDITGFDKDSAKRSLSNLSGSGNEKYKDEFGNWPVVYDKNHRKRNPNTGTTCGSYRANPIYGKRPARQPETDPSHQADMFGAPEVKHKNGISL